MNITFLGHACLAIQIDDCEVLVDPFISGNEKASGKVDMANLNPDYILVTHAHQDHILDVEEIAKKSNAVIVSNYEIATYYEKKGFKVHPMNHGGQWSFGFGKLKFVNAIHTSSFPDGSYGGQPGGFLITASEKTIYIAGDTALTMDMKLLPMDRSLNLAVLPLGDNFTMGIDDAVVAANFLECDTVLGYHFDTFKYIEIDHLEARRKFKEAKKILHLLNIGEAISI